MADQQEDRVESLFHAVVELPPGERAAFLEEACRNAPELLREVEALLRHDGDRPESSWLVSPVVRRESLPADSFAGSDPSRGSTSCPRQIGRFRILSRLGSGGMGIVYEAAQENPCRTVALKILRTELMTTSLLQRFHREAQILAQLQHPGIAQIYDAGVAPEGPSYIAMELVRGLPLNDYSRLHLHDDQTRLEIMIRIADAVEHAHCRGIVHRDLKPSNILVDETGQPKVLDFGVACARDTAWSVNVERTETGQLIGTPQYMSPEAISGKLRDVDARSDVYSLGVILYELLAKRHPYDVEHLALPDVVRVIREQEPARLGKFHPDYQGDVETIVGKALAKEKSRRYKSAGELAEDIRRHLDNQPILARPTTWSYRAQKFTQRNRGLITGVIAVLIAVVVGIAGVTRAYLHAEMEAHKARKAHDFLASILQISETDRGGDEITARQVLAAAEERILAEFADDPQVRDDLLKVVEEVRRGIVHRTPRAMILEVRGRVFLFSGTGEAAAALPNMLLRLGDQLTVQPDGELRIVVLSDLHQERVRPGQRVAIKATGCEPVEAVERQDTSLFTFVPLPKGRFWMGWNLQNSARVTEVEIEADFEIAVHEVTQGQWQAVMGNNPSELSRNGDRRQDVGDVSDEELKLFPVESVSWNDVQQFLKRLNQRERASGYFYRLPTAAEWEYACRAGSTTREDCSFAFYLARPTNDLSSELANFNGNSPAGNGATGKYLQRPTRVGAYPPNSLGICDMHGNVWEWCGDAIAGSSDRPGRGGGWLNDGANCQAATRSRGAPDYRNNDLGFRLVRVAAP